MWYWGRDEIKEYILRRKDTLWRLTPVNRRNRETNISYPEENKIYQKGNHKRMNET